MRRPNLEHARDRVKARLFRQPGSVLLPLVLAQWLFLLLLSRSVVHNGWLFSDAGAERHAYATAWSLVHGHIPATSTGYGWSLLTAPIAGIAGASVLGGLPALVLLQALVLLPVALLTVYGIACRIGGRLLGYLAAAGWVLVPYLSIRLFVPAYHDIYVEGFLPQSLGLTGANYLPSLVCVLVAAWFAVTSMDTAEPAHGALSGLFAGFAVGIDPANALFLAAPAVGYALARTWRPAAAFGVALLPALATFTLWRYRALGHVPHVHMDVDLHHLERLRLHFRDVFYSDRLVEVPFIAGVIAIGRRSWAKSGFVAAWFLSFLLVRGSAAEAHVTTASLFRLVMPAFPAFLIACCSIPLLVPRLGARLAEGLAVRREGRVALRDRRALAAWIVLAAVPLIVVVALRVQTKPTLVTYAGSRLIPVDAGFRPRTVVPRSGEIILKWPASKPDGTRVSYHLFRSAGDGGGATCEAGSGASTCTVMMRPLGSLEEPIAADVVPRGRWTYRVAVAASRSGVPSAGDVMVFSAPVNVIVP
jgi:hypothetical protein